MLAVFPFLAAASRSLADETQAMKRLMGGPEKSAEIASVCIIRISSTYQNDSLHLRKKTRFLDFFVVFMTANQHGSHSQLRALSVWWCRSARGAWWYLCALVPLPARASAAAVHGEVARSFSIFLPQDKESFGLPKIEFLDLGQIFKKTTSEQQLRADFPRAMAPVLPG